MRGSITLADVAAKADVLDVACSQCERTGRYEVATLIERHGWLFTVPELLREVSIDCVRRASVSQHDLCGALPGIGRSVLAAVAKRDEE
jgi:hypothetical protein